MAKSDLIVKDGLVEKALPNAIFKVRIENDVLITGHISGKMRKRYIKVSPGDKVKLEMSPYDLKKGRIVYRHNPNSTNTAHHESKSIRKKT